MIKVPFIDLTRSNGPLTAEIKEAISKVIETGAFVLGEEVDLFEKEFAGYCGADHAVSVNSGTDALHIMLRALNIGPGDEVITTPFTFVATLEAIELCGAKPVLVDISEEDLTIDVQKIEEAVTARTKAVIAVHIYGQVARMREINELCKDRGIYVLEDACQAHGAEADGNKAGNLGHAGAFSFYPSKNLGAFGDGGMIVTASQEIAEKAMQLRNHGQFQLGQKGYSHWISGACSRLDSIQAAILRVKLRKLDEWNSERQKAARFYDNNLDNSTLKLPVQRAGTLHSYYVYAVRTEQRDSLKDQLNGHGIGAGIHYPQPAHLLPAMEHLGYKEGNFPISEAASKQTLSIPCFPYITESELKYVAETINNLTRKSS